MARLSPLVEHLLRRAGFGASTAERAEYEGLSYQAVVDKLLTFDALDYSIDNFIGTPGYVGITTRGQFQPNTVIVDARQRWLFRMVHAPNPLQEKMALFWHHHFATGFTKIQAAFETADATRMMAASPYNDPGSARGQIELFRQQGLGSFRDLLQEIAKDPAMLVWLDGKDNTKTKPQENFGRELMELFTFGVENYVETDVYAAARVFTGWNLTTVRGGTPQAYYAFNYRSTQHDSGEKAFSFPIFDNGDHVIPPRSATAGIQDGIDLIDALARHPETAKRLARRLWVWFVSEVEPPDEGFVSNIANVYTQSNTDIRSVIRAVLMSPQFTDSRYFFHRYAWPAEFVVRLLKEVGFLGFSVDSALTPMVAMGQVLFDPPDVNGWELGPGWFSTAGMLSRMNFASDLAKNQRIALREAARPYRVMPSTLVAFALDRMSVPNLAPEVVNSLVDYIRAGGTWTGSDSQLLNRAGGLFHLLGGSGVYQFV